MKDGAVDALRTVFRVNQTLEAVDHLNEFVGVVLLAIAGGRCAAGAIDAFQIVGVYATILGADVLGPRLIPAIRSGAGQHFLYREEGAIEHKRSTLWINAVGRKEHVAIRGTRLQERTIHRQAANRNLANTLLAEFLQSLLGPLIHKIRIDRLEHGNDIIVILALDDETRQVWRTRGNLVEINLLEILLLHALPANVGNHQATLKEVVGSKLHLLAETRDVGRDHPLEKCADYPCATSVGVLSGIGPNVCTSQRSHEQRDVVVDALVNDASLGVGRTFPRKSISPMLAHIRRLPRPIAAAIISAADALIEVAGKLSERPIIRPTQHNNIRTVLINKCECVLRLCFLHRVGCYDSTLLRETLRS